MESVVRNKKFVSVSKKLLFSVLTTSTVVTTILTIAQIGLEYKAKSDELDSVSVSMEASLIPGVAQMLWNIDEAGAVTLMKPIIGSIDASSVKLTNDAKKVIFEDKLPNFTPEYAFTKKFEIRDKTNDAARVLGSLEVVFFRDKIIHEVRNRFFIILILNGLKTAVVATVLLWIFHRKIAGPIAEISNYFVKHKDLAKVSGDDFKISRRTNDNDEITVMTEQIAIREAALATWARQQQAKVSAAEQALADADELIKQEKIRAEASARLAQLGEMATSIAHEINNPLAIISGYNQLIKKEMNKNELNRPRVLDTSDAMERTILRITKVISGLRAYARDGSQDPMSIVSVKSIVDDAIAMTETRLQSKGVALRINVNVQNDDGINCRSVQIVQTLVAILNNAVDAISNRDDRWVEIGAKRVSDNIQFSVADSGDGIPAEVEARIFEPFFTTKQVGAGTGLGLSIAFGVVKDHNGKIYVDRTCKNTKFVVEIAAAVGVARSAA